jgi:hypothetical protein
MVVIHAIDAILPPTATGAVEFGFALQSEASDAALRIVGYVATPTIAGSTTKIADSALRPRIVPAPNTLLAIRKVR